MPTPNAPKPPPQAVRKAKLQTPPRMRPVLPGQPHLSAHAAPTPQPSSWLRTRNLTLAGIVVVIAIGGSWAGATLGIQQDIKKERRKYEESTAEEQLKVLQDARQRLVTRRNEVQRSLERHWEDVRMKEKLYGTGKAENAQEQR